MWFEICELTKYNLSGLLKFNMLKSGHTVRHKLYDFFFPQKLEITCFHEQTQN